MTFSKIVTSILVLTYFVIWLHFLIKKGSRGYKEEFYRFLEKERKANVARKKEINPDYFIAPDTKLLPVTDYPDIPEYQTVKKKQEAVLKRSGSTMLKLPSSMSNTDLKLESGIANLDKIIMYEENFQEYIRALNDWAESLLKLDLREEAEAALLEAVRLGSELSKSYFLLGGIYAERNDTQKLSAFYDRLRQPGGLPENAHLKDKVLRHLEDLLKGEK